MKTHLLKTSQGIALEINGVVSDCKLEFSEEVSKGIGELWGIWDVSKICADEVRRRDEASKPNTLTVGEASFARMWMKVGFLKAQSINKEKLFTREDMFEAYQSGDTVNLASAVLSQKERFERFLSSLRPDRVECTVEMEENQCDGCKANLPLIGNVHQCSYPTGNTGCQKEKYNRPKITDGKIKVLTIKTT